MTDKARTQFFLGDVRPRTTATGKSAIEWFDGANWRDHITEEELERAELERLQAKYAKKVSG